MNKLTKGQAHLMYPADHGEFANVPVYTPTLGSRRLAICQCWPLTRTSDDKATTGDIVASRAASLLLEGGFFGASAGVREALLATLEANISNGVRQDALQSTLTGLLYNEQVPEEEAYESVITEGVMTFCNGPLRFSVVCVAHKQTRASQTSSNQHWCAFRALELWGPYEEVKGIPPMNHGGP